MSIVNLCKGTELPLNSLERRVGEMMGEERQREAERKGYCNQTQPIRDLLANNVGAAQAELAIARALNLFPSVTRSIADPDLILHGGETVDVKWNLNYRDLLVDDLKIDKPCDYYLVVLGPVESFTFGGWATRAEVFRRDRLIRLPTRRDACYVVRSRDLRNAFIPALAVVRP